MLGMSNAVIEGAKQRTDSAWEEIVKTYTLYIYNLCSRFIRNRQDIEDLTQEVFIKTFKSIQAFDMKTGTFISWITTITKNLLVDYYRRNKRERSVLSDELDLEFIVEHLVSNESPEEILEQKEQAELVQQGVKQLSPALRDVLILKDLEENSYRTIADLLHVPEGTVKSRLSRGRSEFGKIFRGLQHGRGEQLRLHS
jgi:RNA polymerase sigma-70 factor (ECF subfamily)